MRRVDVVEIKLQIVLEGHLAFDAPGEQEGICGAKTLKPADILTSEILANSQRWRDDAMQVHGWFTSGQAGTGAVRLLHRVLGERRETRGRANFLHTQGFALVLIDLSAHGESFGAHTTFGTRESAGVRAALADLRRQPRERLRVIGVWLGAAFLVLAKPGPTVDAPVPESMVPSIKEAAADRLGFISATGSGRSRHCCSFSCLGAWGCRRMHGGR